MPIIMWRFYAGKKIGGIILWGISVCTDYSGRQKDDAKYYRYYFSSKIHIFLV